MPITPGPGIQLKSIVPLGRNLTEYRRMFALTDDKLRSKRFVDVGAGPSTFTAEVIALGGNSISVDPIYRYRDHELEVRFDEVVDLILQGLEDKRDAFYWGDDSGDFMTPRALSERRRETMARFLADYEELKAQGVYVTGELPSLGFDDDCADVALCSHLLFTYGDHMGHDAHFASIGEMLRIAPEVRIFPLLTVDARPSPFLPEILAWAEDNGVKCQRLAAKTRVQRGATEFLQLNR